MTSKRTFILAVVFGAVGFILAWGGWHLVIDHARLHQIWDLEIQRAQAAQTVVPPTPPVTPEGG